MPGVLNFTARPGDTSSRHAPGIYRGDVWEHTLAFPDGFVIEGTPVAQIRQKRVTLTETPPVVAVIAVDVDGTDVHMSLTAEQTAALPVVWVWDIAAAGVTWLTGDGRTFDDVTREAV